jgi:hypothetical protein
MEPNGKQTSGDAAKPGLLTPPTGIPLTLASFNYVAPTGDPCNKDKSSGTAPDTDNEIAVRKLNDDMKALYHKFSAEEDQDKKKGLGEEPKELYTDFHAVETKVHWR